MGQRQLQGETFHRETLSSRDAVSTPSQMRVEMVDVAHVDDRLIHCWAALVEQASEPNPFAEYWYCRPGLAHFNKNQAAKIMAMWSGDDVLIGIIIVKPAAHYGRFPVTSVTNWTHENCFLATPHIRQGYEKIFWQHILMELDDADWAKNLLYLAGLHRDGPVFVGLVAAAEADGRACEIVRAMERAMLFPGNGGQDYWERAIPAKKRKELRRQANRLGELGAVRYETLAPKEAVDQWIRDFLALEMTGWKGAGGSALASHTETEILFDEAVRAAHEMGRLDAAALTLDGRPIAMLFHFLCGEGAFSYKTTYDESLSRFSPGVLLQLENLSIMERRNLRWIDSCAAENHPMINKLWRERRPIIDVAVELGGSSERLTFAFVRSLEKARAWSKTLMQKNANDKDGV